MRQLTWISGVALLAACAVSVAAEQNERRAGDPGTAAPPAASASAASGTLMGLTRDASERPLPDARMQLRNLVNGHVEKVSLTDHTGTFSFPRLTPGTYVVELTTSNGGIVAVSDAVVVSNDAVARTIVQVPSRTRSFAWWLGSTTTVALAQAASLGVLTVNGGQPISPQ